MSALTRVATLAAVTMGTAAALAAPAVAAPSAPESTATPASPGTASPSEESASPGTASPGTASPGEESASPTPSTSTTASAQDTTYLQQAHQTNLAEIAAGNMAQQKSNNQTVKNLGVKFVNDHTKLDQALKSVAQSLGVSLPQAPNAQQQAVAKQLKAASGSQFNNLFVNSQLAGHTQAMQAGQTEIANGSNPQVIKLARDSAPVIASHHQALEAAANTLGIPLSGTPRPTASPSMPVSPQLHS
jgi:putative membrane protein